MKRKLATSARFRGRDSVSVTADLPMKALRVEERTENYSTTTVCAAPASKIASREQVIRGHDTRQNAQPRGLGVLLFWVPDDDLLWLRPPLTRLNLLRRLAFAAIGPEERFSRGPIVVPKAGHGAARHKDKGPPRGGPLSLWVPDDDLLSHG